MNRDADRARRIREAIRNTRRPPRNKDAEAYRVKKELELLRRLHGHKVEA
jgi:hypothetical protein